MTPYQVAKQRDIQTFTADGRARLNELFTIYLTLANNTAWQMDVLYEQPILFKEQRETLPIIALRTQLTGPALWVLAGVHGEEPAGPVATARSLSVFQDLAAQGIPVVLMPLLNPSGYQRDWRYPTKKRGIHPDQSVTDADHLMPDLTHPATPRVLEPTSVTTAAVVGYIHRLTSKYPPLLVIDHHEDEELDEHEHLKPYLYSYGRPPVRDRVAEEVVNILLAAGMDLELSGTTRFGEPIVNGVVSEAADGSIDEFLAAEKIIQDGRHAPGPSALAVVVIETPVTNVPLPRRINAHENVIKALPRLWQLTTDARQKSEPSAP